MASVKVFHYNNTKWEYVITYKQQKHMYLKVRNDQIIISAPFFMQEKLIEDFILKNLPKILEKITILKPNLVFNNDNSYLYFLSKKYQLITKYHAKKTIIYFEFNNLVVCTNIQDHKQILVKIEKFLKQEAKEIFMNRLQYWSEFMNIEFSVLKIRSMLSKWGICQPHTKIITLNYKLIHFGYEVIDYVIIHELTHIIHSHHKKAFWNFVAQYCPNFQECQKILKQGVIDETNNLT